MLGSIHLLKKEHYPLPDIIEDAYDLANAIILETDISDKKALFKAQQILLKNGSYKNEKTIKSELSTKTYALVMNECK